MGESDGNRGRTSRTDERFAITSNRNIDRHLLEQRKLALIKVQPALAQKPAACVR